MGKVLGLIPARGGSKGIPNKNIKLLNGRPLIQYSVDAARNVGIIDQVVVSTDSSQIAAVAKECGAEVPFMRPAALAQDDTPGIDPVLHALQELTDVDSVILLQPTSPFRTSRHIEECFELYQKSGGESVVSVAESAKHPAWMYFMSDERTLKKVISQDASRRQDLMPAYFLNGAIYIASREFLFKNRGFVTAQTKGYIMQSEYSLDLDTAQDWKLAEYFMLKSL